MDINQYRIGELAEKAEVTKRTIHYYIGRGLLPAPTGAGLGTTYSDEHLYRVLLIKKFQDAYLPLDEIKRRMADMDLGAVKRCLADGTLQLKVQEHANEYGINGNIRGRNTHSNDYEISIDDASVKSNLIYSSKVSTGADVNPNMNAAANVTAIAGISYKRLEVGFGLEIHFPPENSKAKELAEMLYRYAQKIMNER